MDKFKEFLNEGAITTIAAIGFVKLLSTNFENWESFKSGIIDKDGKILKKSPKLPVFTNIARKIKVLFQKFVPNKKYMAMLIAIYLLKKEEVLDGYEEIIKIELEKTLTEDEIKKLVKILCEVELST